MAVEGNWLRVVFGFVLVFRATKLMRFIFHKSASGTHIIFKQLVDYF